MIPICTKMCKISYQTHKERSSKKQLKVGHTSLLSRGIYKCTGPWGRQGLHYLREGRCMPFTSGGSGGCSSSCVSSEKWSEGMCGCGHPVMLLSTSH